MLGASRVFVEKVREMVDEIAKVGVVDRNAHASWWEAVAEKAAGEPTNPESSSSVAVGS